MVGAQAQSRRAKSYEEVEPLIALCKAGRLFDVQKWIENGGPLDLPPASNNRTRKKSPLEYSLDLGFHSMVEVLLDGGASIHGEGTFCPMESALTNRRFDLIQLLVDYGFDPKSVRMESVFATWDSEIMAYFIERGADVETEMPLARALCNRIRTALGIFKKYRERFTSFQEQANVALRHHCKEGNMKWVSLLIWAGADPLAPGESEPNAELSPEDGGLSALGFAALYEHYEVFSLKKVAIPVDHPVTRELLRYGCDRDGLPLIEKLLGKGLDPNDQENGGCSAIQQLLERLEWYRRHSLFSWESKDRNGDSERAREQMKVIHVLAKHGAQWRPSDVRETNSARRSLLKMIPDYTIEFAWIMKKYGGCSKEDIEALTKTPTMKRLLSRQLGRLREIIDDWPDSTDAKQDPV